MYKVLIVDDEKMIRLGIQKAIPWEQLKIGEVFTAASAREALECLDTQKIDLMITDISMSEMTGLELVAKLKEEGRDLKIIVLTGYDKFDYAVTALQLHVNDFLLKPVDENELAGSIKKQIDAIEEVKIRKSKDMMKNWLRMMQQRNLLMSSMRELCLGNTLSSEQGQFLFEELKLSRKQHLKIGILMLDLRLDKKDENKQFEMHTLQNICMDFVDEKQRGITFLDQNEQIVFAFFEEENDELVDEYAKQLLQIIKDEMDVTPKLVLGSTVDGFGNLHISYNDAMYVLTNEKGLFEDIIKNESERKREDIFLEVFQQFKINMVNQIGNVSSVLHIFDRFVMAVESYNLSVKDTRRNCFELASAIAFTLSLDAGNGVLDGLHAFGDAISCTNREKTCELAKAYIEKMLSKDDHEEHELVTKVKKKISEHLSDDLTVANIAEEMYVTPNYLSRLFKKIVGEGCNEYIVRNRIMKARSLLETTSLKVGEIATLVGYHDMNYFSLAFKKHTGMSPVKYRESMQNKDAAV